MPEKLHCMNPPSGEIYGLQSIFGRDCVCDRALARSPFSAMLAKQGESQMHHTWRKGAFSHKEDEHTSRKLRRTSDSHSSFQLLISPISVFSVLHSFNQTASVTDKWQETREEEEVTASKLVWNCSEEA